MPYWFNVARWLHILAGAAWLGEVMMLFLVIVPALRKLPAESRRGFITQAFPRVFRWASVFALVSILAGAWLNYLLTGWRDPLGYFLSPRGVFILIGGALSLVLAGFHFFIEGRLKGRVVQLGAAVTSADEERLLKFLTYVPRAGLALMCLIFILMMIGAHGY